MSTPLGKIVLFIVVCVVLAGVTMQLLAPTIGRPDPARRAVHPAGFSIVAPSAWQQARIILEPEGTAGGDGLIFTPVADTVGMVQTFSVTRLAVEPSLREMTPTTFQGGPAYFTEGRESRSVVWTLRFERDAAWYEIEVSVPGPTKIEGGPWMAFAQTFRLEPRTEPAPPATVPAVISSGS